MPFCLTHVRVSELRRPGHWCHFTRSTQSSFLTCDWLGCSAQAFPVPPGSECSFNKVATPSNSEYLLTLPQLIPSVIRSLVYSFIYLENTLPGRASGLWRGWANVVDLQVCAGEAGDGEGGPGPGWEAGIEGEGREVPCGRGPWEERHGAEMHWWLGGPARGPAEPVGWACLRAPVRDTVGQQGGLWNSEAVWIFS